MKAPAVLLFPANLAEPGGGEISLRRDLAYTHVYAKGAYAENSQNLHE